jgi:glycosyltransferase involved in cell wall biosynthesis
VPKVSVIATVYNEGSSVRRLLDSLAAQSRTPDQVVIVDGGSDDGTPDILHAYAAHGALPLRVISQPGANISEGRNTAIAAADGPVIAVTDAGVRLTDGWLAALLEPFERPETAAVAGFFVPDPQTPFEIAMGATVLPDRSDVDPDNFLPSSRSVAFLKRVWSEVGGYPEWLDYCEDLVYDLAVRDRFGPFGFAPEALVHFRPRSSMRAFFVQYYRYARGDGKANLWPKRHAIRYATYLAGLPCLLALAVLHSPWWLLALPLGVVAYIRTPYRRLFRALRAPAKAPLGTVLYACALVPCIRVVGDVAKMVGYPVGLAWRLRHRDQIPG